MEDLKNVIAEENSAIENEETVTLPTETNEGEALVKGVMHERNMKQVSTAQKITKICVQAGLYIFLGLMALIILFPFYFMLISSVKSMEEYNMDPPTLWPETFLFNNYAKAFELGGLGRLFLNTLYVGIVSTLISLVITVLSAFAFARLEFKGKNTLFAC